MIHIPDFAHASTVQIIFCFLAFITVITAFLAIFSRNPIHSALYLVISFFSIAGHYLLLNSQFLAIVHVIVYSGAIMILFLFTIMLMNLNKQNEVHKPRITRLGAIVSFCLICIVLILVFINSKPIAGEYIATGEDYQSIKVLGRVLLNEYMVPFEFASILLLTAMIGVVLLSKKEKTEK
ncbi:NADH-quinone oxidoreductase subunit J [Flavobacterium sufflavum]|uniref:NADH-quinone oxidoreductase subunit J n=1 Tax=Flavobacterium sufflavum TaxID=1921138 RepID=A0A3S2WHD9_9FLAO|nr:MULTISPECIES: NADH-quinone oxidoreductase subunit J [Flavobacterium]MBA0882994.1 NADH-quinone oxidoreductase subunit J [Flavobacterium undicola]RVT79717.1 NADH-quinone oxidoreductase subunit J [Flavobacterium sufflavum]